MSLFLSLRHCADAQDTGEHRCARPRPVCPYSSAGTPRTRASIQVLARVLISLSSTLRGHTGHERAHRCSPVSCMSLFMSLRHHRDTQGTSEHTGARSCPYLALFDTARTYRTRVSTLVFARVPYIRIPVPSMPYGCTRHERAHLCSPMSCMSLFMSFRHCRDTQDTSEHTCAHSCPYLTLFDTTRTHRTRASTLVLARALISLSSTPCRHTGHEQAHQCLLMYCVFISPLFQHNADAQDTSKHIGACLCPVCPYPCSF